MSQRRSKTALALLFSFITFPGCGSDETPATTTGTPPIDAEEFALAPPSCSFACPGVTTDCAEMDTPYACPSMGAWEAIPHVETCPAWDGKYPTPVTGQCTATAPSAEALKRPGPDPDDPKSKILPDGRVIAPAGKEWAFDEPDAPGGMTNQAIAIPGTPYVLTVDIGNQDHAVRAVDTSKIGVSAPVTGIVKYPNPSWLTGGVAFVAPSRVYVATAFGVISALTFDPATGALTKDDAASLPLPPDGMEAYSASDVAALPDGKHLLVSSIRQRTMLVFDIDPASPTYKQQISSVDVGDRDTFGVYLDPHDAMGTRAYLPLWGGDQVVEVDTTDLLKPIVTRTFPTDHGTQGITFLDARWMAVANAYGETISLVDRMTGQVTSVPVDYGQGEAGLDVSRLAWDEPRKRLYAILAGIDAIAAYDVDLAKTPPALTPVGRLPTSYWPSAVVTHPDGSLTVTNLRGKLIGAYADAPGDGGGDAQMRGSVQQITLPTAADLSKGAMAVDKAVNISALAGYPTVSCPAGVKDFPVPATNEEGPSKIIDHIVFIVRENKTFDTLLGDIKGVEGDASLTMKPTTAEMDGIWTNFRELGRTFTISDNFYNLAVKSTQGHFWTTYGRATDFCERTWANDFRPVPLCGITGIGRPNEGSSFEWLQRGDVRYTVLGEIVGTPAMLPTDYNPIDGRYPGGPFQHIDYNDIEKACYFAGRERVLCDLGNFVYMTLPNDHTVGVSPDNPTPETMCAVNDEATGVVIDAIAHSPFWKSTLIVVTEDDPQSGADHVDYHRTPLVMISPWVKRGYVSKTHIDVASLHKIFAHILGLPYPNLLVKNAGLPFDVFSATPDYTPYTYVPRSEPLACGDGAKMAEKRLTDSWDFKNVDEQKGLGEQVMRWMRGKQLDTLPPELEKEVAERNARKAQGLPAEPDNDD